MNLKLLKDIDVKNKTILYRSPYDIGVEENSSGEYTVKDTSRIEATLPTLKYLIDNNCKIVILTWVGRPDGKIVEKSRTTPHAKALQQLLGQKVYKVDDCIGTEVTAAVEKLKPGELLMLENTRFYQEEDQDDDNFAKKLTNNCDLVVFDGFPQATRIHASTTGILRHLPGVCGYYFEKEVNTLEKLVKNPQKPFTVIVGGAKISDKVDAINNLLGMADNFLIGGGTANVFLKAVGYDMGDSFIEDVFVDEKRKEKRDWVELAKEIMEKVPNKIYLPVDLVLASADNNNENINTVNVVENTKNETISLKLVEDGMTALDIGPKTVELYTKIINDSKTIFWNGPMGLFENDNFSMGTAGIASAMQELSYSNNLVQTVIGGGDTIEAAKNLSSVKNITHLSLAGGATLEFLAGNKLPVLEMLKKT